MNWALALLLQYKYVVLVPLAAFEGPVASLFAGFLVRSHILEAWITYLLFLVGDIIPDSLFYAIGYHGGDSKIAQKLLAKSKFIKDNLEKINTLWKNHPRKMMFFGKLAYGMVLPFLVSAGMSKLSYKKFLIYSLTVSVLQYGVIMIIGYNLGAFYEVALKYINFSYGLIAVCVAIFILLYFVGAQYVKKQFLSLGELFKKDNVLNRK